MFKIFLNQIPSAPLFLSLGGVVPFVLLSAGLWFLPYEYKLLALYNLLNYSVIILSFIGAVHWGVAITKGIKSYKHYLIAITPALLSWFMLIGFFDDWRSLTLNTNSGLGAKEKLALQTMAGLLFISWAMKTPNTAP